MVQGSSLVSLLFGTLCLHTKRTCFRPSPCVALSFDSHTWKRSGVGRGGASFWFVATEWYICRPLVRDHRVAKKRPCRQLVVTSSNTQWVRFRELGRPKCFSGREDEWHGWSLKFGAIAATLSDHASVRMNGALQHTTEITLDHPDEASARMFARQMYTLLIICVRDEHWKSFEERLITMAWKRGDCCMNGISRKRDQGGWRC